ncbi:MAG TPA: peptidylprolyl isomerase [Vicinamibacteria bacterium]|nr:peptidylprolyl isomerase [Vicinamibacteria bacterium]
MDHAKAVVAAAFLLALGLQDATAPEEFRVRLETTRGRIEIEVHRQWAPRGADRFYELVRQGYYDGVRFHRVVAGRWAQFGVNGDPRVSTSWRDRPIEDDPFVQSNRRGTIAYAFAVKNGRTTQVFFNLRDNSETHDREPFVPFGEVVVGMDVVDSLYSGYGESSGGGIRAGKQGPLFERGNAYLDENFPLLDHIIRATLVE